MKVRVRVAAAAYARDGLQIRGSTHNDDPDLASIAVQQNGIALRWLTARMRKHPQIVELAVRQNGLALAFAHLSLCKAESHIAKLAIQQNSAAAAFVVD